jgi:hypothetical protein
MTLSIITLSIMPLSITIFSITAFKIKALSIEGLFVAVSINANHQIRHSAIQNYQFNFVLCKMSSC